MAFQRFLPSEFGHDIDRADPVEPGLSMYKEKRTVRRLIEETEIPYTYICCNSIASWPYHDNKHPSEVLPPLDQFQIYGDGNVKGLRLIPLCLFGRVRNNVKKKEKEAKILSYYHCRNGIKYVQWRGLGWAKKGG